MQKNLPRLAGRSRYFVLIFTNYDELIKSPCALIPAKAGIHKMLKSLDSRLRGNDKQCQNWLLRDHEL